MSPSFLVAPQLHIPYYAIHFASGALFLIVKWCTLSIHSRIAQKINKCGNSVERKVKGGKKWQRPRYNPASVASESVSPSMCVYWSSVAFLVSLTTQNILHYNLAIYWFTQIHTLVEVASAACLSVPENIHTHLLKPRWQSTTKVVERTTALPTEPQPPSFPRPVYLWRKLDVISAFTMALKLELQAVIDAVVVALAMVSSHVSTTFCIGMLQTILLPREQYCFNSYEFYRI